MVYLDYSATTPINLDVLDSYNKVSRDYIGNANSLHSLGTKSRDLLNKATHQISELLNVKENEITYTSGATMSNNIALKGICSAYQNRGKKIIVSKLEHPSIYAICDNLKDQGFTIEYVNNTKDGLIDFEDLKKKVTKDTILVSICAVNSELGIREPLKTLRQIIKKENANTFFHSDLTQAIGKVTVNLNDTDLASFSGHKIYGPKGIGVLFVKEGIKINSIINGSGKSNFLNPGTPPLPLIVSLAKALRISLTDLDRRESFVNTLNERIVKELGDYKNIKLNKTSYSIPHILNFSLMNIKPETFIHALEKDEIYLSTNTACASGESSPSVMALYNDSKRASTSIRISLSYLTTNSEINTFLKSFNKNYNMLNKLN